MGLLSFCRSRLQRAAAPAREADAPVTVRNSPCGAARRCEPPMSFAELVAASAFLDFGGMLDDRWLAGRTREGGDKHRHGAK